MYLLAQHWNTCAPGLHGGPLYQISSRSVKKFILHLKESITVTNAILTRLTLARLPFKSHPITHLDRPLGLQEIEASKISRHEALRTGRLYLPGVIPNKLLISVKRLSRYQNHIPFGRINSMKNRNDPIGNQTRDLPNTASTNCTTAYPNLF